jgi:hypothetical protein
MARTYTLDIFRNNMITGRDQDEEMTVKKTRGRFKVYLKLMWVGTYCDSKGISCGCLEISAHAALLYTHTKIMSVSIRYTMIGSPTGQH